METSRCESGKPAREEDQETLTAGAVELHQPADEAAPQGPNLEGALHPDQEGQGGQLWRRTGDQQDDIK